MPNIKTSIQKLRLGRPPSGSFRACCYPSDGGISNAQPGAYLVNSTSASMQYQLPGLWSMGSTRRGAEASAEAPLKQPRLAEPDLETLWDGLITVHKREASMPRQPPDSLGAAKRPVPLFHTAGWLKASAALMGPLIMGLTQFQESRQALKSCTRLAGTRKARPGGPLTAARSQAGLGGDHHAVRGKR